MHDEISARIRRIRDRISRAADRAGRDPAAIRLIGAAKKMPVELVRVAVDAGLNDIGENYVQEAVAKRAAIERPACWHLIGPLQRNKAALAASVFDVVQTVDRPPIGRALAKRAADRGVVLSVLIEVNLGAEESKSGVAPAELAGLVAALRREPALRVDGLMAIPPPSSAEEARASFRQLRELRDANGLAELSMGMSNDFEVAVEEGATMVRIGRAIFGERT